MVKCLGMTGILFFTGCLSLSTFQSPEVLRPGEKAIGIALSGIGEGKEMSLYCLEVYGRYGVGEKCDAGIKMFFPGGIGVLGDIKQQHKLKPLLVSSDFGVSYFYGIEDFHVMGFYSTVLFGGKHFYSGLKCIIWGTFDNGLSVCPPLLGILIGASIGNTIRVLPEINLYFFPETNGYCSTPFYTPGIGIQFTFH